MFGFLYKKNRTDKKIELQSKFPDSLVVKIEKLDESDGYFAKIINLEGCITSTRTNDIKELYEMINDAVYTYLEIPEEYDDLMPVYLPFERERKVFEKGIPADYLNRTLTFSRV